jgi:Aspartyl protease
LTPNQTITGLAVLTVFFTPLRPIRGNAHPADIERHESLSGRQTIPLRIYRNFLPVAEGQVGGISGSQSFVLDTGTAPSILSLKVARRLGLATAPSSFTALGKVMPMQIAVVPEIALGSIHAISLNVQVQDLSRLEEDWRMPIAGIIGMDVLSKSSFRLDYDRRVLMLGESSREGTAVPFDARVGLPMVSVTFEGKTARLLVDTGSDHVLLFGENFGEGEWSRLRSVSQTGKSLGERKIALRKFSTRDIFVGEQRFSPGAIYYVPGSADTVFDGLLGVRALGFRKVSYDSVSKTVYLQN